MQTINLLELEELLDQRASVTLQADGGEVTVEPNIRIFLDIKKGSATTRYCGYSITDPKERTKNCRRVGGVIRRLKRWGLTEPFCLLSINRQFSTLVAFRRQKAIDEMDLAALVAYYRPIADSFVLITPYNQFTAEGEQLRHIDEDLSTAVLNREQSQTKAILRDYYNAMTEAERSVLPDFDTLIDEIMQESAEHSRRIEQAGGIEAMLNGEDSPFLCDHVGKDTKYSQPTQAIWHFYHSLDLLGDYQRRLNEMQNCTIARDLYAEFERSEYAPLKEHILSVTPTFSWHCTVGSTLVNEVKIRLNEQTEAWLLARSKDFDLGDFEDLAFYRGDRLLFSSCTHEGFRTDYTTDDEEF